VVGGGVGARVARAQLRGEELAGVVAQGEHGVVAERVLERGCCLLFLAVADQHVRVQVDHQRLESGRACDSRVIERGAGRFGALRPADLPSRRASRGDLRERVFVEGVQQPPHRGVRRDRPEQPGTVGQRGDVRDRLRTLGDRYCDIDQHPARIMPRARPAHPVQTRAQLGGQRRRVGQIGQQTGARVRHEPLPIRGHHDPRARRCSLHVESAPLQDQLGPSASQVSPGRRALSSISEPTRRQRGSRAGAGRDQPGPAPRRSVARPPGRSPRRCLRRRRPGRPGAWRSRGSGRRARHRFAAHDSSMSGTVRSLHRPTAVSPPARDSASRAPEGRVPRSRAPAGARS
jgi:hypothetical protein